MTTTKRKLLELARVAADELGLKGMARAPVFQYVFRDEPHIKPTAKDIVRPDRQQGSLPPPLSSPDDYDPEIKKAIDFLLAKDYTQEHPARIKLLDRAIEEQLPIARAIDVARAGGSVVVVDIDDAGPPPLPIADLVDHPVVVVVGQIGDEDHVDHHHDPEQEIVTTFAAAAAAEEPEEPVQPEEPGEPLEEVFARILAKNKTLLGVYEWFCTDV